LRAGAQPRWRLVAIHPECNNFKRCIRSCAEEPNMTHVRSLSLLLLAACLLAVISQPVQAADAEPGSAKQFDTMVAKAVAFCQANQAADGSFSGDSSPAITAIVAAGLARSGRTADDPVLAKALAYVQKFVRDDGGIYAEGSNHGNYETCIAIQAFEAANADGRYDALLKKAEAYARNIQWDDEDGINKSSPNFGGAGYGSRRRPDLSNTSFLLDALKSAGAGPDDEAVQKALVFVSRCQNLETEYNTTPFAAKINDGGFYYTPAAGGTSQAGNNPDGGLRSYGSMTYSGLKSLIYAGLTPSDPRVKAAISWLQKHYTLKENPGMGDAGLYFYYQAYARALAALGQDEFVDADGKKHNWRAELTAKLAELQQPDGSWLNKNERWMEGNPNLVTGYALLALSYARPTH
jgi:squalene-hopene/tetraprenyl-beta-curcumene cyclase